MQKINKKKLIFNKKIKEKIIGLVLNACAWPWGWETHFVGPI